MPVPYLHHELFALNNSISTSVETIEDIGPVVIIDDFYAYPDDIQDMLEKAWVPSYHLNAKSHNFKDYYDCRHNIQVTPTEHPTEHESQMLIRDVARDKLGVECLDSEYDYAFNYFKWMSEDVPNPNIQSYPHQDSLNHIASVIYMNDNYNHGTAFYHSVDTEQDEVFDLRVDIEKNAKLAQVIPAKKNRCIVYPSWYIHGAYIQDHSEWVNDWRISQVYFMKCLNRGPKR
tara:strand:- start:2417 stop:3109 length:693 start_codon:yes stop_codon:yes gene_type:complete